MLHTLQPAQFVPSRHLDTSSKCPECECDFVFGTGAMSLTFYRELGNGEIRHGLMCFCSTECLLRWEHPSMLGGMQ